MDKVSYDELREIALKKRREASESREKRYAVACEEAFQLIVEGSKQKIVDAATAGRFRCPIFTWKTKGRQHQQADKEEQAETTEETQSRFGSSGDGDNGLHIMTLVNPTGIPYEQTLIAKLREHFSSEQAEGQNNLHVYTSRNERVPNQYAVFVAWERQSYGKGKGNTNRRQGRTTNRSNAPRQSRQ